MKKRFDCIKLLGLICAVAMLLSGCTIGTKKTKVVLNDRQKEILAQQGLPTDYEKLNTTQKGAITAIEELMCYLDESYDDEFTFSGRYWAPGLDGPEHIEAHCSKGDVIVWRKYEDGQFTIWDNYDVLVHAEEVTSLISSYFEEQYEADTYKSILSIYEETDVHGNYYLCFLNCDQDQMDEKAANLEQWLKGQNLNARFKFVFLGYNEEDFNRIDAMTFPDLFASHVELSYALCVLEEDGNIIIRGKDE